MKTVILAAGRGTRMRPMTNDTPKPLIEINGRPFLYYLLKIIKMAGLDDIGIVVGYKKYIIEKFLDENNIEASLINQEEQLGTGHAVSVCKEFCGEEDFVVVMGDNLYSPDDMRRISRENGCCVAGIFHEEPERFGVLVQNHGKLKEIIEKSPNPPGNIINTGLYKFTPEIFPALTKIKKSPRGEIELTDAINILANKDRVGVVELNDYWVDFGNPLDIKSIEKFFDENNIS